MADIRVLVSGSGKMGRQVAAAMGDAEGIVPVGYVEGFGDPPETLDLLRVHRDPAGAIKDTRPDVIVDFTNAAWTPVLAEAALAAGVRLVIGTTGLPASFMEWLSAESAARKTGAVVASNFAITAVLMMHFAKQAARFFDNAEIIELHHDQKVDAPSGTAKTTAEMMLAERKSPFLCPPTEKETIAGTRGGELGGIAIHSVRLPGLVAHQEVLFGAQGQTLTIRQDSTGRESFMPGVVAATRAVMSLEHLVVGLDALYGLE